MGNAQMSANGRSTALIRLLGVCAAAALLAVCWTAAGASAQSTPTVTVEYKGWAASEADQFERAGLQNPLFDYQITGGGTWHCRDLRCHFLKIVWEGIPERPFGSNGLPPPNLSYTVTVTRDAPSEGEIGIAGFNEAAAATEMSVNVILLNEGGVVDRVILGMPWVGEKVTVTVTGDRNINASAVVKIPAAVPESFRSREAQGGSTLVTDSGSTLPKLVSVWPKLAEATHYEVQYTFRTRSRQNGQRLTKLTRIVSASQGAGGYEALGADWSQHPNASELNALDNDAVGSGGGWIAVVTTLPELLAGAGGWPQETVGGERLAADAAIAVALGAGKNAVGIRVRPMIVCAAPNSNSGCSPGSNPSQAAPLALRGKKSKISYVVFRGGSMAEWVSSAGTAR